MILKRPGDLVVDDITREFCWKMVREEFPKEYEMSVYDVIDSDEELNSKYMEVMDEVDREIDPNGEIWDFISMYIREKEEEEERLKKLHKKNNERGRC